MKDYFYQKNGFRYVVLDGKHYEDFVKAVDAIHGERISPAVKFMISQGFSEEEAEEYLAGLPKGE